MFWETGHPESIAPPPPPPDKGHVANLSRVETMNGGQGNIGEVVRARPLLQQPAYSLDKDISPFLELEPSWLISSQYYFISDSISR